MKDSDQKNPPKKELNIIGPARNAIAVLKKEAKNGDLEAIKVLKDLGLFEEEK